MSRSRIIFLSITWLLLTPKGFGQHLFGVDGQFLNFVLDDKKAKDHSCIIQNVNDSFKVFREFSGPEWISLNNSGLEIYHLKDQSTSWHAWSSEPFRPQKIAIDTSCHLSFRYLDAEQSWVTKHLVSLGAAKEWDAADHSAFSVYLDYNTMAPLKDFSLKDFPWDDVRLKCLCGDEAIDPLQVPESSLAARNEKRQKFLSTSEAQYQYLSKFFDEAVASLVSWTEEKTGGIDLSQDLVERAYALFNIDSHISVDEIVTIQNQLGKAYEDHCSSSAQKTALINEVDRLRKILRETHGQGRAKAGQYQGAISRFNETWAPTLNKLNDESLATLIGKTRKVTDHCSLLETLSLAVPMRVQFERERAIWQEYVELSEQLVNEFEATSRYLNFIIYKKSLTDEAKARAEPLIKARLFKRYRDGQRTFSELRSWFLDELWPSVLKKDLSDRDKRTVLTDVGAVLGDQAKLWRDFVKEFGQRSIVESRMAEFNNTIMADFRLAMWDFMQEERLEDINIPKTKEHILLHLASMSNQDFYVSQKCFDFAEIFNNDLCWQAIEFITDDTDLDVLETKIDGLSVSIKSMTEKLKYEE